MMRRLAGVAALALLSACSPEKPPAPDAPTQSGAPGTASGYVWGYLQTVGLDGNPLPGMIPMVTNRPNAFDEPVAMGQPTGPDGKGAVRFPKGQRLCLRAWDPNLERFANNYYDILPNSGDVTSELTIVMVRAAAIEARVLNPAGGPTANQNVGLMMFHPDKGPWWPTEADTDAAGFVRFAPVPAGEYLLKLKAESGPQLEIPAVSLPPGETIDLGPLRLQ